MAFVSDTRRMLDAQVTQWQDPYFLARSFLDEECLYYGDEPPDDKGAYTLRKWRGEYYVWKAGCYHRRSEETVRVNVTRWLQDALASIRRCTGSDLRITRALLANILLNMDPMILIRETCEPHSWLNLEDRPSMIAMRNGLLHLEGPDHDRPQLAPHTPHYFTLACLPFDYEPEARCPVWQTFLKDAMAGRQDLIELLQRWVGYLFRADLREQKFLLCVGEGANGKGVFFEDIQQLVGRENGSQVPLARFANPFALSATIGKLVNATNESSRLIEEEAEALLKAFVAGDRFTFERKYRDPVSATPTAKVMISTNALPRFHDKTQGIWRRVLLVPFDRTVPEGEQIKDLADEIVRAELPGVFNWALEGLRALNADRGFAVPEISRRLLEEHRRDVDPARAFLLANCAASDGCDGLPTREIYQAYVHYCQANGYRPTNAANFGRQVRRTFPTVERARHRSGRRLVWQYTGLAVQEGSDVATAEGYWRAPGAPGKSLFVT